MFRLGLNDNSILKDSFESIVEIVDEVACTVDSEGFHLSAIDRSHVSFVTLQLGASVFDEYICDVPDKICIDTHEFMKILKRVKKNDYLKLEIDENNLIIFCEGDVDRMFKIRLIDLDYEHPHPPSLELPVEIQLQSSLLKDCLVDMELFNENLNFKVDSEYFIASSEDGFGDAEFKYLHGIDNITDEVSSSFSIDKLKSMLKASKFSEVAKLKLGNDMPLILNFELDTGDGELGFLLAPRLTTEEE